MKTYTSTSVIVLLSLSLCYAQFSSQPSAICGGEANNFVVTKVDNNSSNDIVIDT